MATRILHYSITPDELEDFLNWARRDADVRLLAKCSDSYPFPTYDRLADVRDARGPDYGHDCLLWNASISPAPEARESLSSDNVFGRHLYFVDESFSDVASIGGPYGRLYTSDIRSPAFKKWFASLVGWFRRRCRYYAGEHEWASPAYVGTLPWGEHQLFGRRALEVQITLDDIRELMAFARTQHDVCFIRETTATPAIETYDDPAERREYVDEASARTFDVPVSTFETPRLVQYLIWNRSLFAPPRAVEGIWNASGERWYQIPRTNLVMVTPTCIALCESFRFIKPERIPAAEKLVRWYETLITWLKERCSEERRGRRSIWVSPYARMKAG